MTTAKEPDIKNHAYAAMILRWPDTLDWLTGCCRNDRPDTSECAASLHAKTFAVDGERIFVGSFNFDPRSTTLNTEMGILIESPQMAEALHIAFDLGLAGLAEL